MGWDLRSKREIENLLKAAQTAVLETAQRLPGSPELEAYLDGYVTALMVVAQGLGVEVQIQRQRPGARTWDEEGRLLPPSLLAEDWLISKADDI